MKPLWPSQYRYWVALGLRADTLHLALGTESSVAKIYAQHEAPVDEPGQWKYVLPPFINRRRDSA